MGELTNKKCAWPVGTPKDHDFGFCGNASHDEGSPYCEFHTKMAYRDGYVSKSQQYKNAQLKKSLAK